METAKLKLAFFGTPNCAADVLKEVVEDKELPVELLFVVTQPDRPVGRKQIITPTPVKIQAQKNNLPVYETLRDSRNRLYDADLVLLYAYGELIPKDILSIPRWGFWNIHPSFLPLYRGPSPIAYPLLLGDTKTGVSLISMDEHLDSGAIIGQEVCPIQKSDMRESLENRLSKIGYRLFKKNVHLLLNGTVQKKEQNHSQATKTRLLTKQDGFIPYSIFLKIISGEGLTKEEIPLIIQEYCKKYPLPTTNHCSSLTSLQSPVSNLQSLRPKVYRPLGETTNHYPLSTNYHSLFRALSPWPGVWTNVPIHGSEKRLKITGMVLSSSNYPLITKVQLEGKKEVDFKTFQKAYTLL